MFEHFYPVFVFLLESGGSLFHKVRPRVDCLLCSKCMFLGKLARFERSHADAKRGDTSPVRDLTPRWYL